MLHFFMLLLITGNLMAFTLTSEAFEKGNRIPKKYTCQGDNISPPLTWDKVEGAKSYVLLVDDPDAPKGTVDHWVLFNIDPSTRHINEGSVPKGAVQGLNQKGDNRYMGPCPPSGTHRYFFRLYALNRLIDLNQNVKKSQVEEAIKPYIISQTELMGTYSKE